MTEQKEDGIDPVRLDPTAHVSDIQFGEPYSGWVQSVTDYGVFVDLTPREGSDIAGLMHKSELPPLCGLDDFAPGEPVIVELSKRDGEKVALRGIDAPKVDTSPTGDVTPAPDPEPSPPAADATAPVAEADGKGVEAPSAVTYPYDHAMRTLQWLRENDYDVTRSMVVQDDGTVTVHVVADPADGGSADA